VQVVKRFSLRTKIMFAIGALVVIAMLGGAAAIWMVHLMDSAVSSVIGTKVAALNVSQELEGSLAMQKGSAKLFLYRREQSMADANRSSKLTCYLIGP
jgi:hypothetical protein